MTQKVAPLLVDAGLYPIVVENRNFSILMYMLRFLSKALINQNLRFSIKIKSRTSLHLQADNALMLLPKK